MGSMEETCRLQAARPSSSSRPSPTPLQAVLPVNLQARNRPASSKTVTLDTEGRVSLHCCPVCPVPALPCAGTAGNHSQSVSQVCLVRCNLQSAVTETHHPGRALRNWPASCLGISYGDEPG